MESSQVVEDAPLHIPYSDYLDELCAYYMSIGVPCEEFWHGDYTRLRNYERANDYVQEAKNQQMWLQGAYIYNGLMAGLAQALGGKRSAKYLEKPLDLFPKNEYQKKLEEIEMKNRLIRKLNSWKARFNGKS